MSDLVEVQSPMSDLDVGLGSTVGAHYNSHFANLELAFQKVTEVLQYFLRLIYSDLGNSNP